ncbi:MAG: ethylbenzene dehydrogenase-related protein [Hyphomicrobiales bacterium]
MGEVSTPARPMRRAGPARPQAAAPQRAVAELLRSDWFTVVLHWLSAIAMFLSLFTGMRIAADSLNAVIPKMLAPILPQGEVWTVHFYAGLSFFLTATAYIIYLRLGQLFSRNSLAKLRVMLMPAPMKMKWGALNTALHWLLYILLSVMMITGVTMYLGYGGSIIQIHRAVAIALIGYILAHVIVHFLYGGWRQLLRIFIPASLMMKGRSTSKPAWVSLAVAIPVTAAIAAVDVGTRDTLVAGPVAQAPAFDKFLEDPVWTSARPVYVHTSQGENLGGTGESLVEIRAVHDDKKIYFAFRWEDPTRSIARLPLIKKEDGWHMLGGKADTMDVVDFYEDKFSVIFNPSSSFGDGGVAHLGPAPLADKPVPMNGRGLHYTTDGSYVEMWQWKSTRGGLVGGMDHQYMGPPREPTPDEAKGIARYQAGYWNYDGAAPYVYNYVSEPPGGYRGTIGVKYLPKDLEATLKAMGKPVHDPNAGMDEDQRYWMYEDETVPYSKEADDKIPVGTIIPGVMLHGRGEYTGARGAIHAKAKWADGHWTLIASRDLKASDTKDQEFAPGREIYMWVAVYDHTQTRHSRHTRPVRLVVQE